MSIGKPTLFLSALVICAATAFAGGKGPLDEAAETATSALADVGFVAKIDIGNLGKFYVHPDGQPLDEREQRQGGYGKNTFWAMGGKVLVRAGETGRVIFVRSKYPGKRARDNEFWVFFNRNRHVNAAGVAIVFDRPVTPADITPERIARAVASVVTIHGYEPGAALAAAFDEALAAAPVEPQQPASAPAPALVTLRVWVEPASVAPGSEIKLWFEYELGPGERSAVESVSLAHGDRLLPGYPLATTVIRSGGVHQASYSQTIPNGAPRGVYTVRGEVCVEADCIVRTATFEVAE